MSGLERGERGTAGGVEAGTRVLLVVFAVFTALAATLLVVLTARTDRYFAWTIRDEPTAAFLGAAYGAGFVLSVLALRQDRWSRVRVALVTVTAFTVLTLIATLLHMHVFHLAAGGSVARLAAWVWLVVYLVIPVACLAVVVRQERHRDRAEAVLRPMPGWLVALLAAQGAALFAAGAALYAGGATRHHVPEDWTSFWPLPLAPMTSQSVGGWLLAFAFGTAVAIRERDLSRGLVPAASYTAFGVFELLVVLRYRTQASADDPWLWAYIALLVTIVAAGGYGWRAALRPPRAAHPGTDAAERALSGAGQPGPSGG